MQALLLSSNMVYLLRPLEYCSYYYFFLGLIINSKVFNRIAKAPSIIIPVTISCIISIPLFLCLSILFLLSICGMFLLVYAIYLLKSEVIHYQIETSNLLVLEFLPLYRFHLYAIPVLLLGCLG